MRLFIFFRLYNYTVATTVYDLQQNKRAKDIYNTKQFLKDIAVDMEKLSEEDKRFIIERVDLQRPFVLTELYNALNEYME